MGFFDKLTGNDGLTPEERQEAKDAKAAEKQAAKEAKAELKSRITYKQPIKFIAGQHLVNAKGGFLGDTMMQLDDNTIIFNLDDPMFFKLTKVEFAGEKYHEEVKNEATESTKSKGKAKKKRHGLGGAVIGAALGPAGMVAGAMVGSHMGKDKNQNQSNTLTSSTQTVNQIEDPSSTTLTLKKASSDETVEIVVESMTADYQKLNAFHIEAPEPDSEQLENNLDTPVEETNSDNTPNISDDDPVAELRKYKGLLDDGIITQEDFDAKKKQLLGL